MFSRSTVHSFLKKKKKKAMHLFYENAVHWLPESAGHLFSGSTGNYLFIFGSTVNFSGNAADSLGGGAMRRTAKRPAGRGYECQCELCFSAPPAVNPSPSSDTNTQVKTQPDDSITLGINKLSQSLKAIPVTFNGSYGLTMSLAFRWENSLPICRCV